MKTLWKCLLPAPEQMNKKKLILIHKGTFKRVFVFFLWVGVSTSFLLSQPVNNAEVREKLIKEFLLNSGLCLREIKGLYKTEAYKIDCMDSVTVLSLSVPEILCQKKNKEIYFRTFIQPVEIQGKDTLIFHSLVYKDSMNYKELKTIRKQSPEPLKGENPFPSAKYIQPAIWVSGTILVALGLFYWRG